MNLKTNNTKKKDDVGYFAFITYFMDIILFISCIFACMAMAGLFVLGFFEISKSINQFFKPSSKENPIELAIKGIEYLFLAPLPFLLILALGRFLKRIAKNEESLRSKGQVLSVKVLSVSLLIATLATALIGKVLKSGELSYEFAISGSIFIAILTLYIFILEKHASEIDKIITFSEKQNQDK